MGIKWQDVKVGASFLTNKIYIGKVKNGIWTDRSGDMTNEVIGAVVEMLLETEDKEITLKTGEKNYRLKLTVEEIKPGVDD